MVGLLNIHRHDRAACYRPDEGAGMPADRVADDRLAGLTTGSRVATPRGWRPVETITVGDEVMTFDNGLQPVVAVGRGTHFAAAGDLPAHAVPIHVPIGAIGNDEPMVLLPEQIVMLESDAAEALTGDPFALVPAKMLEGFRGIDRIRGLRPVEAISLHFDNDELVFADGGALVLAPSAVPGAQVPDRFEDTGGLPAPYEVHRGSGARALIEAMAAEDARAFAEAQGVRAA